MWLYHISYLWYKQTLEEHNACGTVCDVGINASLETRADANKLRVASNRRQQSAPQWQQQQHTNRRQKHTKTARTSEIQKCDVKSTTHKNNTVKTPPD